MSITNQMMNQDKSKTNTIEQLRQRYDLDGIEKNKKVWYT